jgi:uncharacterized protein (DUF2062 family)
MTMRDISNTDEATMKASGWTALKGNPDAMVCVSKATYEDGEVRIMKSTKVVELDHGCLVFSTTEHSKLGVAEALVFVPGATMAQMKHAFG